MIINRHVYFQTQLNDTTQIQSQIEEEKKSMSEDNDEDIISIIEEQHQNEIETLKSTYDNHEKVFMEKLQERSKTSYLTIKNSYFEDCKKKENYDSM